MQGRVVVVTGASSGIGEETARTLAAQGATVVLACRSVARGEESRARMTGNTQVMQLDLADLTSVRAFVESLRQVHPRVDVLINNAGMWSAHKQVNSKGVELTWATNVLGPFVLTNALLPLLGPGARIINVASKMAYGLDLSDVGFEKRPYKGMTAYAQSKQANRLWTWELARRTAALDVTANAVHPGGVNTGIFRKGGGLLGLAGSIYFALRGKTVAQGAETVVHLASSPEVSDVTGTFYAYMKPRPCQFADVETEQRLWKLCESMTS